MLCNMHSRHIDFMHNNDLMHDKYCMHINDFMHIENIYRKNKKHTNVRQ